MQIVSKIAVHGVPSFYWNTTMADVMGTATAGYSIISYNKLILSLLRYSALVQIFSGCNEIV